MEASRSQPLPLRIDVATSQIEGGQALGWIDPDRVTGCVAFSEPREAFERFVLPHLEAPAGDVQAETLPAGVTALIAGLQAAHLRLYRENHSLMKEPNWVRLTAACAEERRVYLIKTQASWIYLLREGRAFLVGGEESLRKIDAREEALGGPEKLRLQVTSVEVTRDDMVLLVAGDASEPPDLRAIVRLFAESRDLKRACDGLVNLLGLQGPSAAVAAFRFTPLLSGTRQAPLDTDKGRAVLGEIAEMAREFVLAAQAEPAPTPPHLEAVPPLESAAPASGPAVVPAAPSEAPAPDAAPAPNAREASRPLRVDRPRRARPIVPVAMLVVGLLVAAFALLSEALWPGWLQRARELLDSLRSSTPAGEVSGAGERPDRATSSTDTRPTLAGRLDVTARELAGAPLVWLEGQTEKLPLPTAFADLDAGWYRLFFEDARIPLWERKVLVRAGETTRIEINNAFADDRTLLRVESFHHAAGRGPEPRADSVFVDRHFVGCAPIELEVDPGLHAVRIGAGGESHCEVLRLAAGSSRFVTPQFGLRARPSFHHRAPERVVLQGPVLLAVEIHHPEGRLRRPQLELPEAPGGPRSIPLIPIDSGADAFIARIEPAALPAGEPVRYYFSVQTPTGEEAVSELYQVVAVTDAAELAAALTEALP